MALALASGQFVSAATGQVGVSESTVRRRLAEPAFRRLVARYRNSRRGPAP